MSDSMAYILAGLGTLYFVIVIVPLLGKPMRKPTRGNMKKIKGRILKELKDPDNYRILAILLGIALIILWGHF